MPCQGVNGLALTAEGATLLAKLVPTELFLNEHDGLTISPYQLIHRLSDYNKLATFLKT